jgi:hypothetical protein
MPFLVPFLISFLVPFFVPLVPLLVPFLVFTIIAVAVPVRPVVVIPIPVLTFPAATVETIAVIARRDPACRGIRRTRPVTVMPSVAVIHRVVVTVYPYIAETGALGRHSQYTRGRRRTNPDSNVYLRRN